MSDSEFTLNSSFDIDISAPTESVRHLVLVLHGILDKSTWANELHIAAKFQSLDITVKPVSYSLIGPISLFLGIGRKRRNNIVKERLEYALSRKSYDQYTLICHSNGTKIFSEITEHFYERLDYIFLCGSICHLNDDIRFRNFKNYIINDCGINDWWPLIASLLRPGTFGDTGSSGFCNEPILDRYYAYGHSDATKPKHFKENIIPVLATGKVDVTEILPGKRSILARWMMIWLLIILSITTAILTWVF